MKEDELKKTIYQMLKEISPDTEPTNLKEVENIQETLNIDSYDALQFIVALDEKLGVEIPEQDYGKVKSIKDLISYIKTKIKIT
jgi:acyl carrier protein